MLRVGLLLDNENTAVWVAELVDTLRQQQGISITTAFINQAPKANARNAFLYKLLRKVDAKFMKIGDDPFQRTKLNLSGVTRIKVHPIQNTYSDKFPADILEIIKKENIDVLLRFGFRILRGDILNVTKFGVISLHHGDTYYYRGGPPAFWEVVKKSPVTKVTVQQLTDKLDAGLILKEVTLRTDSTSFYRNQVKIYWAGMEALLSVLQQLSATDQIPLQHSVAPKYVYTAPLYKNPGNFQSLQILFTWILKNTIRKLSDLFYCSQWQILYAKTDFPFSLYRFQKLVPPKDRIWADPFVVKKDGYTIFFEEKLFSSKDAHISYLQFDTNGKPLSCSSSLALKEPYHLSYPFIFSFNEKWFMIPESAANNQLHLYECITFPAEWKKVKTIFSGKKIYDATMFHHQGYWYLFCNEKNDERYSSDAYLHIYYTTDFLNDSFVPHPMNPVYRNVNLSRSAGSIFMYKDLLIRPAQVSSPNYGAAIRLNKITHLSPTNFEEVLLEYIYPDDNNFTMGIHTLNTVDGFSVVDIQKKRFRLF